MAKQKKRKKKQIRYCDIDRPSVGAKCVFDCTESRTLVAPFENGKKCCVTQNRQNTVQIRFYGIRGRFLVHPTDLLSFVKKEKVVV